MQSPETPVGDAPTAEQFSASPEIIHRVANKSEAQSLTKRLKQLEQENNQFGSSLAQICDENAKLTDRILSLEGEIKRLVSEPLAGTSILKMLFDKDQHAGWLSGGKSATKEKLQHTLEDLQNEFIGYRQTHMSSTDEVQALVSELHAAHGHCANLARVVKDQQKHMNRNGSNYRIIVEDQSDELDALKGKLAAQEEELVELRNTNVQASLLVLEKDQEIERLKQHHAELEAHMEDAHQALKQQQSGAVDAVKYERLQEEFDEIQRANSHLEQELTDLRDKIQVKERFHDELLETTRRETDERDDAIGYLKGAMNNLTHEMESLQRDLAASENARQEAEFKLNQAHDEGRLKAAEWQKRLDESEGKNQELQRQLTQRNTDLHVLQERLVKSQEAIAAIEAELEATVSLQNFADMEVRWKTAQDELDVAHQRAQHDLEEALAAQERRLRNEFDAEVQRIRDDHNADLESTNALRSADTASVHQRVAELQSAVRAAQDDAAKASRTAAEDRKKSDAKHAEEMRGKDNEIAALRKDLQTVQERLVKSQEAIAAIEGQLEATVSLQNFAEMEVRWKTAQDELDVAHQRAQHDLDEALAAQERRLREEFKKHQEDEEKESESRTNLRQDFLIKKCASVSQELKLLEVKNASLQSEIDAREAENKSLKENINTLLRSKQELEARGNGASALEAELVKAKEKLAKMDLAHTQSKLTLESMAGLEVELDSLRDEVHQLRSANEQLAARLAESEANLASRQASLRAADNELSVLRAERAVFVTQVSDREERIADLEQQLHVRTRALDDAQNDKHRQSSTLENELEIFRKRVAELEVECESHQQQAQEAVHKATEMALANEALQQRIDEVSQQATERKSKSAKSQQLADELSAVKQQLVDLTAKYDDAMQSKVRNEAVARKKLEATESQSNELVTQLKQRVAALEREVEERNKQIATKTPTDSAAPSFKLEPKLYTLKVENDRLHDDLRRANVAMRARDEEAKSDLSQMEAKLKRVQAELRDLQESRSRAGTSPQRSAPPDSNANGMLVALRAANERLMAENEALMARVGKLEQSKNNGSAPAASPRDDRFAATALYREDGHDAQSTHHPDDQRLIEELQIENGSLKLQLQDYSKQLSAKSEECHQLQDKLNVTETPAKAAADDADPPGKRKKVKSKKGGGVLGTDAGDTDLLQQSVNVAATDAQEDRILKKLQAQVDEAHRQVQVTAAELSSCKTENLALKESVSSLTLKLKQLEEDFEEVNEIRERESRELMEELQSARRIAVPLPSGAASASSGMVTTAASRNETAALTQKVQAVEREKQELQSKVRDLESANRLLTNKLETANSKNETLLRRASTAPEGGVPPRSLSPTPTTTVEGAAVDPSNLSTDVNVLHKQLALLTGQLAQRAAAEADLMRSMASDAADTDRQLRKKQQDLTEAQREVDRLAKELLPIKQKMADYVAFVDRLGVSYPFPPGGEGTARVRLHALGAGAASAKDTTMNAAAGVSPVAAPKARTQQTRSKQLPSLR